jgi:hypothetical protein
MISDDQHRLKNKFSGPLSCLHFVTSDSYSFSMRFWNNMLASISCIYMLYMNSFYSFVFTA